MFCPRRRKLVFVFRHRIILLNGPPGFGFKPQFVRFVALTGMGASRPSLPLGTQGHLPECPELSGQFDPLIHRSQVGSTGRRRRRRRRLHGDGAGLPVGPIRPEHWHQFEPEWQPEILQGRGPRPRPGGPLGLGQFAHLQKPSGHGIMIELSLCLLTG